MKKVVVISLGGSLIAPNDIDYKFLERFKKVIRKHEKKYKFVVVCGGGSIARKYISALKAAEKSENAQSMLGRAVNGINALFLTYLFGKEANDAIPGDMKKVKNLLLKNEIVFCGALRYADQETSDSNAAKLAKLFGTEFINLTKVKGLYDNDPAKYKDAKFIPKISWKDFHKMADKIEYHPGQHFVLDQKAAEIIENEKITTYIIGSLKELDSLLSGKKSQGTIIEG